MVKVKEEKPRKKVVVEEVEEGGKVEQVSQVEQVSHVEKGITEEIQDRGNEETSKVEQVSQVDQVEKQKSDELPGDGLPPHELPLKHHSTFPIFWVVLPPVLILVMLAGGIFVYQKGLQKGTSPTPEPTPTISPEETPTPSPEGKKVDLTEFPIAVQNGSGIGGEATRVKSLLEKAGFKVASAGNAKTYDYKETVIQAKKEVSKDFLDELRKTLADTYSVAAKVTELSTGQASDVVVIVGQTKAP